MSEETLGRNIRSEVARKRQIVTGSRKTLTERAAKRAEKTGEAFVPPTKEEIKAECNHRWQLSIERKLPKVDVSEYFG